MRKVLFPQKFHFLFSSCFSYSCLESYVTRGDLCRANTVRNDDALLPIAHTATDTPGGDSCVAVCSALRQRTAVSWLQTPQAAPPVQEGSAGVGSRAGRDPAVLQKFLLLLRGRNRAEMQNLQMPLKRG